MKAFFAIFILSCTAALLRADSGNIVIYGDQSTLNIATTFLNAAATFSQQCSTIQLQDQLFQQDGTLNITNITMASFGVTSHSYNYVINASNSSVVVIVNTTFIANFGFMFSNAGNTQAAGVGQAAITATNSSYSTYIGSSDGKPQHVVTDFQITWDSFTVSTSFSPNSSEPVNQNITTAFNTNVTGAINAPIIEGVIAAANTAYANNDSAWPTVMSYEYTLRRSFNWNNSYTLSNFNATDFSTLATINGSIEVNGYTNTSDTSTVNIIKGGKPHQIAYSLQGFQNFIQFGYDNGYFVWNFDKGLFPLTTFDYSIGDLSNVIPDLASKAPFGSFVEFTCTPTSPLTTTFDANLNMVNLNIQTNCGVNVVDSATSLANITFTANVGVVPSIESTGTLNFVLGSGSYVAGTATVVGQTLSPSQTAILEYYLKGALAALPGTFCIFGSGILLPTTSLSNLDYRFDENWFYISYY